MSSKESPMSTDYSHLFALSSAEKLRLVEALWDDIAAHPEEILKHYG